MTADLEPRPVPARLPLDEPDRLDDLYAYEILDTDPEAPFDDLVLLAARLCGAPMARVNFIDARRQWTKAVIGMARDEAPREEAFCAHTIVEPGGTMLVRDAREDERFRRHPIVLGDPGVRAYAGVAFRDRSSDRPLGALCVLDTVPRDLGVEQLEGLQRLARLVTAQLELRRLLTSERRLVAELRELDRQKAEFAAVVVHDFRSPLTAIRGYAELLADGEVETDVAVDAIVRSSGRMLRLVDDLSGSAAEQGRERVDLAELVAAAVDQARPAAAAAKVEITVAATPVFASGDPHRLAQAVENLVGNAVKYAPGGTVLVTASGDGDRAVVEVRDDGVGIPRDELPRLFERFFRASTSRGFAGTGVGLAVVKAVADAHGGAIDVASAVGAGTTFTLRLPRG